MPKSHSQYWLSGASWKVLLAPSLGSPLRDPIHKLCVLWRKRRRYWVRSWQVFMRTYCVLVNFESFIVKYFINTPPLGWFHESRDCVCLLPSYPLCMAEYLAYNSCSINVSNCFECNLYQRKTYSGGFSVQHRLILTSHHLLCTESPTGFFAPKPFLPISA